METYAGFGPRMGAPFGVWYVAGFAKFSLMKTCSGLGFCIGPFFRILFIVGRADLTLLKAALALGSSMELHHDSCKDQMHGLIPDEGFLGFFAIKRETYSFLDISGGTNFCTIKAFSGLGPYMWASYQFLYIKHCVELFAENIYSVLWPSQGL